MEPRLYSPCLPRSSCMVLCQILLLTFVTCFSTRPASQYVVVVILWVTCGCSYSCAEKRYWTVRIVWRDVVHK